MIMCKLENGGLVGFVCFEQNSYIVRIWSISAREKGREENRYVHPFYYMSFGNGIQAEDRLLELLEHPSWTLLKYC